MFVEAMTLEMAGYIDICYCSPECLGLMPKHRSGQNHKSSGECPEYFKMGMPFVLALCQKLPETVTNHSVPSCFGTSNVATSAP
jgi:hypothetical protein